MDIRVQCAKCQFRMEATSDIPERCDLYRFRDGEHRPTCEAARANELLCGGDGRFFVASRESIEEENTYLKVLNGRLIEILRKITDSLTRGELDEQAWIEGHYFIAIHSAKEAHDKAIKDLEKEVLDLKGTLPPNNGGNYRTLADDSFEKLPQAIKGGAGA